MRYPLDRDSRAARGPVTAAHDWGIKIAGQSVLIVDDNELNLRLAETVLSHAGFDVKVARTAAQARDRLAEREWDAVLMDLRLPDGNGLDIVRELRADPTRTDTRIAALTASALVGDPQQAFDAGCHAYISKPIEVRTFAEEVRTLIDLPDTQRRRHEDDRPRPSPSG